jgi:N-acetylglucosaminyl-diphospho-decaprenol L-rhamnosyltransferase
MRFIAVIPNYNSGDNLRQLLPEVLKQSFDEVFVIDDASTDQSPDVADSFAGKVELIRGETNLGPAGNRNRIIKHLRPNDFICFIDADTELLSNQFIGKVLNIFEQETTVGIIGGLIFNKEGRPMTFNYGYFSNAVRDFIGSSLEVAATELPFVRPLLKPLARPFTMNLDIRFSPPQRQEVDWVSEALCFVRGDVFREVDGFRADLRYHEGQDLAARFYQSGYKTLFWPEVHARHLEIETRPHNRTLIANWFKLRRH